MNPADRAAELSTLPVVALAQDNEPSAWGNFGGLALLAGVPAVVCAGAALFAWRRYPIPLGPRTGTPASTGPLGAGG